MRISDWSSDVCSSDLVICESTYGDRIREEVSIEERRTLLEAEISGALVRGGNLVIPVFALERTQELLLDIASLINAGRLPQDRKSVVQGKRVSVRVDPGGGRINKKQEQRQTARRA